MKNYQTESSLGSLISVATINRFAALALTATGEVTLLSNHGITLLKNFNRSVSLFECCQRKDESFLVVVALTPEEEAQAIFQGKLETQYIS